MARSGRSRHARGPTAEQIFQSQNPSYNFYPNLITPPAATGTPFITFWPKTARKMTVDVHWFAPEGAEGHELWPTRMSNFERILEEDMQFAPRIQESVETAGFRGMYLSYQERRIYHWHEELDRRIGASICRRSCASGRCSIPGLRLTEGEAGS